MGVKNSTQREEDSISSNDNTLILRDNNEKYVSIEKMNKEIDILNKNQKQLDTDEKEIKLKKQLKKKDKNTDINNNIEKYLNIIKEYIKLEFYIII